MENNLTIMETLKISDLPNLIKGYHFNEADTERLDVDQIDDWTAPTEKEYNKITRKLDKTIAKGKGYQIYVWYDVSGFDYWVNNMNEPNYAQVTIYFENGFINKKQLPALIKKLDRVINKVDNIIFN